MHAFLDACAAGVIDGDDRDAEVGRRFHHVADLLRVHAAERSAGDREVLREGGDRTAVDVADARDDAVAGHLHVIHAGRVVIDVHAGFLERSVVVELVNALTGVEQSALAALLLLFDSPAGVCRCTARDQLFH